MDFWDKAGGVGGTVANAKLIVSHGVFTFTRWTRGCSLLAVDC